jgi:hypothetical protein
VGGMAAGQDVVRKPTLLCPFLQESLHNLRKLCTLSPHHPTRKAIFEFDKLVRSIYTLR